MLATYSAPQQPPKRSTKLPQTVQSSSTLRINSPTKNNRKNNTNVVRQPVVSKPSGKGRPIATTKANKWSKHQAKWTTLKPVVPTRHQQRLSVSAVTSAVVSTAASTLLSAGGSNKGGHGLIAPLTLPLGSPSSPDCLVPNLTIFSSSLPSASSQADFLAINSSNCSSSSSYLSPGGDRLLPVTIGHAPVLLGSDESWHVWLIPLLTIFAIVTTIGNGLVVFSILAEKALRTSTNFCLVSLALADMLVGAVVMPLATSQEWYQDQWLIGTFSCNIFQACDVMASTCSILNLCLISHNRYMAIAKPIIYNTSHRRKLYVAIGIATTWVVSIGISAPLLLGINEVPSGSRQETICAINNGTYAIYLAIVSFFLPSVAIAVQHVVILRALTERARHIKLRVYTPKQQEASQACNNDNNNNQAAKRNSSGNSRRSSQHHQRLPPSDGPIRNNSYHSNNSSIRRKKRMLARKFSIDESCIDADDQVTLAATDVAPPMSPTALINNMLNIVSSNNNEDQSGTGTGISSHLMVTQKPLTTTSTPTPTTSSTIRKSETKSTSITPGNSREGDDEIFAAVPNHGNRFDSVGSSSYGSRKTRNSSRGKGDDHDVVLTSGRKKRLSTDDWPLQITVEPASCDSNSSSVFNKANNNNKEKPLPTPMTAKKPSDDSKEPAIPECTSAKSSISNVSSVIGMGGKFSRFFSRLTTKQSPDRRRHTDNALLSRQATTESVEREKAAAKKSAMRHAESMTIVINMPRPSPSSCYLSCGGSYVNLQSLQKRLSSPPGAPQSAATSNASTPGVNSANNSQTPSKRNSVTFEGKILNNNNSSSLPNPTTGTNTYKQKQQNQQTSEAIQRRRSCSLGQFSFERSGSMSSRLLREDRAIAMLFIITVGFFTCWLPYFVATIVNGVKVDFFPALVIDALRWLGHINSTMNPIFYSIFNKDFRIAIWRRLTLQTPKSLSRAPSVASQMGAQFGLNSYYNNPLFNNNRAANTQRSPAGQHLPSTASRLNNVQ